MNYMCVYFLFFLAVLGLHCIASLVVACGFSCPTACEILVPRAGIKPMSLGLAGGFLTAGL